MAQAKDPLGNAVSLEAKLTEAGVKLRANSRAVSGIDRLVGNLAELINAPVELRNARNRSELRLLEGATDVAMSQLANSPELAVQVLARHFKGAPRRLTNEVGSITAALDDLSARPPTVEEASNGPEALPPDFVDRWQRYAEDASTEELRTKWGKVLASEIRQPGRISRRTMRAVDELPPAIAVRFEELCAHRLGRYLIKGLAGNISDVEATTLAFYDLLVNPGLNDLVVPFERAIEGDQVWVFIVDDRAIGVPVGIETFVGEAPFITFNGSRLAVPVYVLSDVGFELASIFENRSETAWEQLARGMAANLRSAGGGELTEYRLRDGLWERTSRLVVEAAPKQSG